MTWLLLHGICKKMKTIVLKYNIEVLNEILEYKINKNNTIISN
jgi:hypothetical protein